MPKEQVKINLPDRTDQTLVELTDNVTFRWLQGGRAYEIVTKGSTRKDVDTCIDANLAAIQSWNQNQTFYSVQDFTHRDVQITPYFKSRLNDVAEAMDTYQVKGASMIVLDGGLAGQLMKILSRFFVSKVKPVQQVWFTDINKAHEELANRLAKEEGVAAAV